MQQVWEKTHLKHTDSVWNYEAFGLIQILSLHQFEKYPSQLQLIQQKLRKGSGCKSTVHAGYSARGGNTKKLHYKR